MARHSQQDSQQEEIQQSRERQRSYRQIMKRAEVQQGELELPSNAPTLNGMLKETDALHEKVTDTKERRADANTLACLTERGARMAQKLNEGSKGMTVSDLCAMVRARFGDLESRDDSECLLPEAFDWLRGGRLVSPFFKAAPGFSCMLGPLAQEPKVVVKKAPTQRASKAPPLGEVVNPQDLPAGAEENTTETTRDIEIMYGLLVRHKKVPLLHLFLDHEHFHKTVENLFALSFLIRDGRVELRESHEGGEFRGYEARLAVPPANRNPGGEGKALKGGPPHSNAPKALQFIMSYDMDDWETWKQACSADECLMPSREESNTARAATQAGRSATQAAASRQSQGGRKSAPAQQLLLNGQKKASSRPRTKQSEKLRRQREAALC